MHVKLSPEIKLLASLMAFEPKTTEVANSTNLPTETGCQGSAPCHINYICSDLQPLRVTRVLSRRVTGKRHENMELTDSKEKYATERHILLMFYSIRNIPICMRKLKLVGQFHFHRFPAWLLAIIKNCIYMLHVYYRTQWLRGIRHEMYSPARTLGSWVRMSLRAWMSVFILCLC
jgi:hypothetical protein